MEKRTDVEWRPQMREYDYPVAFSHWGDEERAAIARVIKSGRYTMGAEVEAFEHEFASWHGMKHGVMVNSGSSANLLAVAALFHKRDNQLQRPEPDEVIVEQNGHGRVVPMRKLPDAVLVPALAWSTTYAPLVQHGLDLRLLDCDETWNAPIPDHYRRMKLRLIIACSILGNPGYLADWKTEADKIGAYFIEDNCESFGAVGSDGRLCGTHGIMNTFSFFYSHQISAIEGGMILTNDDECASLCRKLRAHGWTRDVKKPERFEDEYDFEMFGYNLRPLELHAAVAREQLKKQDGFKHWRQQNQALFANLMDQGYPMPITLPKTNGEINPFGINFLCENEEQRRKVVNAFRENGIDCRLPTGGSFNLHRYGKNWAGQKTPQADDIHRRGLFIGNAPFSIEKQIHRANAVIRAVFHKVT